MKKLIPFLFVLVIASCGKKEWNKSYATKKCNDEMSKNANINGKVSKENLSKICDCVGDKMMANYKSEAEADKDQAGAEGIGRDCATEVLMGGNQEGGQGTPPNNQ